MVAEIRRRVRDATRGLTVSAGIGPNFLLAKMGADVDKPDGQHRIGATVPDILSFLRDTPTRKVGPCQP